MSSEPDTPYGSGESRSLGRIFAYYAVLVGAAVFFLWRFPDLEQAITLGQLVDPGFDGGVEETFVGDVPLASPVPAGWNGVLIAGISLLGSLTVMLPVTWTYMHIKRHAGYDESVVHALLILPIAVTGIVLIVKGSLALAFSLAGIVAAVRFRTTLKDTKDAVYIFLAIGVGLAAGVQALGVALVLSLVFNAVNLVLWQINFGNIYMDEALWRSGTTLGDAVAGRGSAKTAVQVGDTRLMAALSPSELQEVAVRMGRMNRYLHDEAPQKKERKRYSVLMVYTPSVEEAQRLVEPHLDALAVRWSLAEIVPGSDEISILEYLVRIRDDVSAGAVVDTIRETGGATIRAAELRSLKGLAKGKP